MHTCQEVSCEKSVPENFVKFAGTHLRWTPLMLLYCNFLSANNKRKETRGNARNCFRLLQNNYKVLQFIHRSANLTHVALKAHITARAEFHFPILLSKHLHEK